MLFWQNGAIEMAQTRDSNAACGVRKAFSAVILLGFVALSASTFSNDMTIQPEPGAVMNSVPESPVPDSPSITLPPLPTDTGGQSRSGKQQPPAKPLWSQLTPTQQQALAPLSAEWNNLDAPRKSKWLAIGNKFVSMKPDEQQRLQARMRDWVKLTPEQRRIVRENYARAKTLNPNQKSEQWQRYQELSEEQKKKLAADAPSKKHIVTLPPASQSKSNLVQPIKSTPKPVLEQSVTPQAATRSPLHPPAPPATR